MCIGHYQLVTETARERNKIEKSTENKISKSFVEARHLRLSAGFHVNMLTSWSPVANNGLTIELSIVLMAVEAI